MVQKLSELPGKTKEHKNSMERQKESRRDVQRNTYFKVTILGREQNGGLAIFGAQVEVRTKVR